MESFLINTLVLFDPCPAHVISFNPNYFHTPNAVTLVVRDSTNEWCGSIAIPTTKLKACIDYSTKFIQFIIQQRNKTSMA
jgi:hypothetical protein